MMASLCHLKPVQSTISRRRPARPTDGLVYVSGAWRAAAEASVSVFDHGLLYGDGVFEGIRAYNGRVFKLERHIDRLFDSAKAIRLEIPHSHAEVCELVAGDLPAQRDQRRLHPARRDARAPAISASIRASARAPS